METEFLNLGLDIIGLGVFNYEFGSVTTESPVIKAVYGVLKGEGVDGGVWEEWGRKRAGRGKRRGGNQGGKEAEEMSGKGGRKNRSDTGLTCCSPLSHQVLTRLASASATPTQQPTCRGRAPLHLLHPVLERAAAACHRAPPAPVCCRHQGHQRVPGQPHLTCTCKRGGAGRGRTAKQGLQ